MMEIGHRIVNHPDGKTYRETVYALDRSYYILEMEEVPTDEFR